MPPKDQRDPSLSVSIFISMRQLVLIKWRVAPPNTLNPDENPITEEESTLNPAKKPISEEESTRRIVNIYLKDAFPDALACVEIVSYKYCKLIPQSGVSPTRLVEALNSQLDRDWIHIFHAMNLFHGGRAHRSPLAKLEGDPTIDASCASDFKSRKDRFQVKFSNIVYLSGGQKYDELMRQDLNFFSFSLFYRSFRDIRKELLFTEYHRNEIAKQQEQYLYSLERQASKFRNWEFMATEYPDYQEFNRLRADSELFTGVSKGRLFIFSAPERSSISKISADSFFGVIFAAVRECHGNPLDYVSWGVREPFLDDIRKKLKEAWVAAKSHKSYPVSELEKEGFGLLENIDQLKSEFHSLWLAVRGRHSGWQPSQPPKEQMEQYKELQAWLYQERHAAEESCQDFLLQFNKLISAECDLRQYCTRTDVFKDYVTKYPTIFSFAHPSVLKHAEYMEISLYVWSKNCTDKGVLTLIGSYEKKDGSKPPIHILEMDGGFYCLESKALAMSPQVEKDWLLSISPRPTGIYEGIYEGEHYTFKDVLMTGGDECIFAAIGVTPKQVAQFLLAKEIKADLISTGLAQEIKAAFQEGLIGTERSKELLSSRDAQRKVFTDLWYQLRRKHPHWKPGPNDTQQKQEARFIFWLEKNGAAEDAQRLLRQELSFFQAEKGLNLYCQETEAFSVYLDFMSRSKPLLGSGIFSLYAMHANISVAIWIRGRDNNLILHNFYKRSLPKKVVHIPMALT